MFDEIYCASRFEFVSGRFHENEHGKASKTVLAFMVSSIGGKYLDGVALFPVTNLDATKINECIQETLRVLHNVGFEVVLFSTDNACPNRSFLQTFQEAQSRLVWSIQSRKILSSCTFNLFTTTRISSPVSSTNKTSSAPTGMVQQNWFTHQSATLEAVFKLEYGKPLKMAHKLSHLVFHPAKIERTNVKFSFMTLLLVLSSFTRNLSTNPNEWIDRVELLKTFRHFWNVANVKNPKLNILKRDSQMLPISSSDCEPIKFLRAFLKWIDKRSNLETATRSIQGDYSWLWDNQLQWRLNYPFIFWQIMV